nr:Arc family DNA-binding protein [Burkholderia gladioli]
MATTVANMTKPPQPPSRTADQFVVRLPDGMRDRIADMAKRSNRSMNAEIVARLDASFSNSGARAFVYGPEMTGLNFKLEQLEAENKLLGDHQRTLIELVEVQRALLQNAGLYLDAALKTHPAGQHELLDNLNTQFGEFGIALAKMDWDAIATSTIGIQETKEALKKSRIFDDVLRGETPSTDAVIHERSDLQKKKRKRITRSKNETDTKS